MGALDQYKQNLDVALDCWLRAEMGVYLDDTDDCGADRSRKQATAYELRQKLVDTICAGWTKL